MSDTEVARWASEQAALIKPLELALGVQAECGRLIAALGGEWEQLPVAQIGRSWVVFEELLEWSRQHESIVVISEGDRETAAKYGETLATNVIVEPHCEDSLIVSSLFS